jgi:GDP-4-dehydro-6-deoxy-D-mannose reductase
VRALITGMGGFVGGYLAEHLLAEGWQVNGTILKGEERELPETVALSCKAILCDITEPGAFDKVIEQTAPEVIFHLAAFSSVAASWEEPEATFQVNVLGTLAVINAVRQKAPSARVLLVGSGEVYGESFSAGPASEDTPLRPLSPYATSKACSDWLAEQYAFRYGIDVRRVRPFNHIGPRQKPFFVTPSFAKQIASIEAGLREPTMSVGNLEVLRDFTDVRDMVKAYRLAATQGVPGAVYNVCSGHVLKIEEVLEGLLARSSISIEVHVDPKLFRSADIPIMSGDSSRLMEATGWAPSISWDQTLDDLLAYWRTVIAHEPDS